MITVIRTVILLGSIVLVSGCYESTEVVEFEPGVYKGSADPLLSGDAGSRAEALSDRFNMVQTDR